VPATLLALVRLGIADLVRLAIGGGCTSVSEGRGRQPRNGRRGGRLAVAALDIAEFTRWAIVVAAAAGAKTVAVREVGIDGAATDFERMGL
jgi:hypothetical protein